MQNLNEAKDYIPYWDFNAPFDTSYQPRDTSASVIFASGAVELSTYVNTTFSATLLTAVNRIINSLISKDNRYYVQNLPNEPLPAVLLNATTGPYHGPSSTAPFDVAQSYADYYFTETLVRLNALQQGRPLPFMKHSLKRRVGSSLQ